MLLQLLPLSHVSCSFASLWIDLLVLIVVVDYLDQQGAGWLLLKHFENMKAGEQVILKTELRLSYEA